MLGMFVGKLGTFVALGVRERGMIENCVCIIEMI